MIIKPKKKGVRIKKDKVSVYPIIPDGLTIAVDTREQIPYLFPRCQTVVKTLHQGDYSVEGDEDLITVERKSLSDFYGSITSGRKRLEAEFKRMQSYMFRALVIEANEEDVLCPELSGRNISSNSVMGSITSFEVKYGLNVYFGDRAMCENKILNWFTYWFKSYGGNSNDEEI